MNSYALPVNSFVVDEQDASFPRTYRLIKDMPAEDKPREKLLKYGPAALSINELIAVVLNTGTKKEDVLAMSSRVVKEYGERTLISQTNAVQIAKDLDIPLVKAVQIVACGELGRRFFQKKHTGPAIIRNGKDVYDYVRDMHNLSKEYLRGLYLNTHHRVIHDEVISIGTINSNIVHPREVFKPAIEYGAAAVVLVHNHPSGIVKSSQADIEITQQIIEAGRIIGIHLVDHVVVAGHKFASINVRYE